MSAQSQANFGAQPVGGSVSSTVTVTARSGGTVQSVRVLTLGAPNLDFTDASGNCASANLSAGQQCTETVKFSPTAPGQRLGAVELLDSSSKVLGTAYLQGTGDGGLGVLIPGTAETFAGNGDWKHEGDGELATKTEVFLPSAIVIDGAGDMFIADSHHDRIRIVCSGTTSPIAGVTCGQKSFIYTVANVDGNLGYAGDGQLSTSKSVAMNTPSGLTMDGAGNLYIADTGNNVIRKVTASTGILTTIAGTGSQGLSGDGGAATAAQLNQPDGVAVDLAGNVVIADTGNNRIRVVCATSNSMVFGVSCPAAGDMVTIAGSGGSVLGDGGLATAALLANPYTIAFDSSWNLYIADSENQRIRVVCAAANNVVFGVKCTATGIIETVAGNGSKSYGGDGGVATAASINSPSGLVIDAAGNLYIADTENFFIRKVSAATSVITTIAGNGSGSFSGDAGPANLAGIYGPYGLALDANGNLYIAEFLDNRVREVLANLSVVPVKTPVRQGSTSAPVNVTVENDGPGALTLTGIQPGTNTGYDAATTTCVVNGSLGVDAACTVAAEFAPASSPAISGNQAESGNIDIPDETVSGIVGSNSPLVIQVTGTATPVNATTVVLTSSPNPSNYNQIVTFTAAVTTGAGTGALSGNVSFFDGATQIGANATVDAKGVAVLNYSTLAVGSHIITAKYNGDTLHFANTSDPYTQVVNEATKTTLISSANPSALNTAVTFTATVTTSAGGGVVPDGTVTFLDGSNTLGTVTVTGGVATYTTSTLADGLHAITAVFSGDAANNILGSTSNTVNQDVLAASAVALTSSLNPSNYGNAVTFTATVTSNGSAAATGVVNFLDGGAQIGTASLVGTSGVATFTTSGLAAGTHSITAEYKGSPNDGPGTSPVVVQTVNLAQTTTALSVAPSPGIAGAPETLTAKVTVTAGSATVTGKVTFTDGTTTLGTGTVNASGLATLAVTLAPGAHSLVAAYGGDANDNVSTSAPLPFTVVLAMTKVVLTTSGTPAQALSTVTFTATVSGNGGTPTGNVVFSVDGVDTSTGTLVAGVATFATSKLTLGTHTIVATYGGDTNDDGSKSSSLSEVIQPIPTVTDLGASATTGANPQTILVATTLGATGPKPTGTVTFLIASKVIGSSALDSSGVATLMPDLPPGSYSIVASYGGDSVHGPSTSQPVTISGQAAGFGITVTPPTLTLKTSQNGTVKVTFISQAGFADKIGTGCLSLPVGVNCHFSSNTFALKSGTTQVVQLTIDTNAPLNGGGSASNQKAEKGRVSLAGMFLPVSLFFGWLLWRMRKRNPALLIGAMVLWATGVLGVSGCGASFSQHTAKPGNYIIQVGGIGTGSNISHYVNVTLDITQ